MQFRDWEESASLRRGIRFSAPLYVGLGFAEAPAAANAPSAQTEGLGSDIGLEMHPHLYDGFAIERS
jgi:hypothetical protein